MYFSKAELDRTIVDPGSLYRILRSSYETHQQLWRLFSHGKPDSRDFLYRKEEAEGWPRFYIVSRRQPLDEQGMWDILTKNYNPLLHDGQRLRFSLRANCIRAKRDENGRQHRHDVVMEAKSKLMRENIPKDEWPSKSVLIADAGYLWLSERAGRNGFTVDRREVTVDGYLQQRFCRNGGKRAISITMMDFNGILTVADSALFLNALFEGVGPAKAFGCGLLLIKPVAG